MAKLPLSLLLVILTTSSIFARKTSSTTPFINSSCRRTRYQSLCIECLSNYPNRTALQTPQQFAQVSLSLSLYRSLNTRRYLLKVARMLRRMKAKELSQTVQDCLEQVSDGVDQLNQSIKELHQFSHGDEEVQGEGSYRSMLWHVSNIESWVSAALTDANLCIDEFPGRRMSKLKATIKAKVLNVAQCTSNALALFHRFATRYLASTHTKP